MAGGGKAQYLRGLGGGNVLGDGEMKKLYPPLAVHAQAWLTWILAGCAGPSRGADAMEGTSREIHTGAAVLARVAE